MSEKSINLDDKKINNSNFYKNRKPFEIHDIDIDNVVISKKEPYGKKSSFKHFIGYNDNDVIRPLCMQLPQMIEYVKNLDKTVSCKIIDKGHNDKSDNDKYIKTKVMLYGDKVNTHFQGNKIPKENASYKQLLLTMLDSVIRVNKHYYPQTLL